MEAYKEFFGSWNNVIPNKIKVADLENPNETNLTNILLSYLEQFGFSIQKIKEKQFSEDPEVQLKFKTDLVYYINHLYKLGNESSPPFTYYDLIKPTPKKTYHVLKYLLNYLLFFKMVKGNTKSTQDQIKKYENLKNKLELQRKKLQEKNLKEENVQQKIEVYLKEIPKLDTITNELKEINLNQHKEMQQVKLKLLEYDENLNALKREESYLLKERVTNDEATALINDIKHLKEDIKEQIEFENANLDGIRQRKLSIQQLKELIEQAESVMENLKELFEKYEKDCSLTSKKIKLKELTEKISSQKQEIKGFKLIIKQNFEQIQNLKKALHSEELELKSIEQKKTDKEIEIHQSLGHEIKIDEDYYIQLHNIDDDLTEQEEVDQNIDIAKKVFLDQFKENMLIILNKIEQ